MFFAQMKLAGGEPLFINMGNVASINDLPDPNGKRCRILFVGGAESHYAFSSEEFFKATRLWISESSK
jgi:hypothetical protein